MSNEFCSAEDVRRRLTAAGYKFCADLDSSGAVSTAETADTITPAIQYAGNLCDACVLRAGCSIAQARGSGNQWLRDRAIDVAAYRVSTTGGRGQIASLKDDYDAAVKMLAQTTKIPGLQFNYPLHQSRSARGPIALNPR
jgi:hypothetical protein